VLVRVRTYKEIGGENEEEKGVTVGYRIEKGVSLTDIRILPGYMEQVLHQLGI
jgi:hypothetical protein